MTKWRDYNEQMEVSPNASQPMCGEMLSDAVIVERRNAPRRLRANDDEMEVWVEKLIERLFDVWLQQWLAGNEGHDVQLFNSGQWQWKKRKRKEYLYSTIYTTHSLKVLRHG